MASIREHRGRWQVRWRNPAGKQTTRVFRTKREARRFAEAVETDKRRGLYVDPTAGRVTFGEYAVRWQASRADKARSTRDRDASYLASMILPTFGSRTVASVTVSEVEVWLGGLDRAPATKAKALQIARSVFAMAVRDRAVGVNPAGEVKAPRAKRQRQPRVLTDDEAGRLLAAAEDVDETRAGIVWVMLRAGLRIGEAIALRRRDVDLATGTLTVAQSMSRREGVKAPKSDAGRRTVPMPTDLAERLRRHMAESSVVALDGFMFVGSTGRPLTDANYRNRTWARTVAGGGLDGLRPHDLRHTCATRLVVVDRFGPAELQMFLGHEDARTSLDLYTSLRGDQIPTPSTLPAVSDSGGS